MYTDNMDINELQHILDRFAPLWPKTLSCTEGWYELIFQCDKELSVIDPDYLIHQIKEKFGSLRYYFEASDASKSDAMNSVVREYELKSLRVCELTGKVGALMKKDGYYKTLEPTLGSSIGYALH